MLRLKKEYADPNTRTNKSKLDDELADIRTIMKKNISEVLDRGEKLECMYRNDIDTYLAMEYFHIFADVSKRSSEMLEDSKKFKWGAKKLNLLDAWKKYSPFALAILLVLAVLYWRFFL